MGNQNSSAVARTGKRRIAKIILLVLLGIVIAAAFAVFIIWHNELATLASIKQVAAPPMKRTEMARFTK